MNDSVIQVFHGREFSITDFLNHRMQLCGTIVMLWRQSGHHFIHQHPKHIQIDVFREVLIQQMIQEGFSREDFKEILRQAELNNLTMMLDTII